MAIRWRSQSVVLAVLVTFIFFFVLRNDRLRGVSINPDHGSPGGTPVEAQFDEKMEGEFMKELDIFYGEVRK
jgi:hypothetical protein